ncbi:hypothetical protein [Streptomyces sp. SP18BB07]|uniref:hypothetical protein n=1 Tax=Streptomyces sp. SP18BB07 TaxID=3002522 RepID=UPI002E76D063|nr:hypothetical protein [Streptomyces sp. SP18BB07]MEE1763780.1 hypothetical protein [Streptomyces sp. SP18BB07]
MRRPGIPRPIPATPFAALLVCGLLLTAGTACSTAPPPAPPRLSPDDVIRAATQRLTDDDRWWESDIADEDSSWVGYNGAANDNGDSHTWAMSCCPADPLTR